MIKDQKRFLLLFVIFLIISCLCINPKESTYLTISPSKQLKTRTTIDGNSERIDYIDDDGNITVSENLGYATVIIKTNNQEQLESYYDEQGNPAVLRLGYCAIMREYDNNGNTLRITYLGTNGKPVSIRNGYASEIREYNQQGQLTSVRYYDAAGEPVCSVNSGYGRNIQYDENGNQSKVTYINSSGEPMMTQRGYATIYRKYYLNDSPEYGKAESEFYFGAKGEPVRLQLDQYGLHTEYDKYGRATTVTFLDADGNPMINNRGYATVRRAFSDNNQVVSELYFDQYGNPCQLSEGQYGFRWKDGKKVYLDAEGNDQINLKNILYNQSWLVIIIAIAVILLSVLTDKKTNILILIFCLCAILYLTLMSRNNLTLQSNIRIFQTFWQMLFDSETRAGVLKNIWLFIPLGTVLYKCCPRRRILLVPLFLSIMIEAFQYLTGIGYCDLSDIVSNWFGSLVGYLIVRNLPDYMMMRKQNKEKRPAHQEQ